MPPSLFIALRFISHRRKAILLSLTGVVLGVAFFICVQAQTQGFEQFFIKTVLGSSGAIIIQDRFQTLYTGALEPAADSVVSVTGQKPRRYTEGITDPETMMRTVEEFSNVAACSPVLDGNAAVRADFRQEVFRVQGIDLERHLRTTALREQIVDGDLAEFRQKPNGVILGYNLARNVGANVGQEVLLVGPDGSTMPFIVCAIFQTGNISIDEKRGLLHIGAARRLLRKPFGVSLLMVKLRDPARAPQLATHLERLLQHRARSWQERERGTLQIFRLIHVSGIITVSTIILLAGFSIFNILTLMVLDKVREIAVLRSMGYRRRDISAVFLWQGLLIAAIGSALGCAVGAALTYGISKIPVNIRGLLTTSHFLVHWSVGHYLMASLIAFVAIFLASYFPARRAAKLAPVTILRGGGQ